MNPLRNLINKKFKDLKDFELLQVVQNYCDQNKYSFNYNLEYKNRKDIEDYFINNFHQLHELKSFFKYWTK